MIKRFKFDIVYIYITLVVQVSFQYFFVIGSLVLNILRHICVRYIDTHSYIKSKTQPQELFEKKI